MKPLTQEEIKLFREAGVAWLSETQLERLLDSLAALTAVAEAAKPLAKFIAQFDARPLNGIGDEFYAIHTGTQWEASLRLSDLRRLAAALEQATSVLQPPEGGA